jgi:hypothetical protein
MSVYNAIRYNNSYANAGSLVLLSTQTASASASLSFTSGIDSTYSEYMFIFNNIHPATDSTSFTFNLSIDSGSNYNVAKTTTMFRTQHYESGTGGTLDYIGGNDLANGTGEQFLHQDGGMGNDNDQAISGYLQLFEPSSTTFVKHFMAVTQNVNASDRCRTAYVAGYGNTTSAIDGIRFIMASGNIDAGTIQMFGVV